MSNCRLCGYPQLTHFLDLGFTPPADQFLSKEQLDEPEINYPLRVVRCDKCMFAQLSYVVPPEILYKKDYPYESSITSTGRTHFDAFAKSVVESFNIIKDDLVIDIGSNVGVLLSGFKKRGCEVLGFDPAENIALIAQKNGIPTIPTFFNSKKAEDALRNNKKAKVITATNVFAHIDDLNDLMKGVDLMLDDDGIFIIEAPYLLHLLENLEYDTIYHEHLSYLSLLPLIPFFQNTGFQLFDVKKMDIHGGSIRMFVCRQGKRKVAKVVNELVKLEVNKKIHRIENLKKFSKRVLKNREDLLTFLWSLKKKGKRIAAVSAPAKGMTLLNYCKIGQEILEFVTEKSLLKIKKFTPGTHLQVFPDSALLSKNIDYALLLAWNFKYEIMENLSEFSKKGGKFIVPIPEPEIIE